MQLNDTLETYDVAEALVGETGKFEVTTPAGVRFIATCQPGHSIVSLRPQSEAGLFRIRKIAEAGPYARSSNNHAAAA